MKKFLKIIGALLVALIIIIFTYVTVTFPPVMAGMASKTMCSCVFVSHRTPESVRAKELQVFPGLSSAAIEINTQDSTVEATIFWKSSKAIFRKGLGCTLLAERSEEDVRSQNITLSHVANLDALDWPTGNRIKDTLSNVDVAKVNRAMAEAFLETDPDRPKNTSAIVVVYDGRIIGEQYAPGIDRKDRLMGWSMNKSITNALVGILVMDRKLQIELPAPIEEWKQDERGSITLNNLLQATSGLTWSESYFVPTSHFHNMFTRSDDKGGYAAGLGLKHKPGDHFEYSSGTTNILSKIIRQQVGDTHYYSFPYARLFNKIGMTSTVLEVDPSGTFVGSSYAFATARDWARFGMLFLNDGVWNGERILPEGWVKYTTTPSAAARKGEYGAQWWLNAGAPQNIMIRKEPELPADAYWADGFEEQWVLIVPSKRLVIVRLGISHHGFDFPKLVNSVLAALPLK